jgi:hypothetical protein
VGALVRELRAQGDRIVDAIRETSAEQAASREAMADVMLQRGAGFLRAALDEGTPRTVVLDPPTANDTRDPAPTTPPGGPANDRG